MYFELCKNDKFLDLSRWTVLDLKISDLYNLQQWFFLKELTTTKLLILKREFAFFHLNHYQATSAPQLSFTSINLEVTLLSLITNDSLQ